ncbi:2010_t:CDS:2 [Entrophospora sp. SA101]|nr:2010_t:CDS:2 [Entrophospora sp. SA101]CAJ0839776.1 17947_t:CDS:2 [Entrophospora sp. SA101]
MSYLSDDTTIISLRYLIHSNKELMGQHKGLQKNFTHNSLELLSKTNKSSINATNAPEIQNVHASHNTVRKSKLKRYNST